MVHNYDEVQIILESNVKQAQTSQSYANTNQIQVKKVSMFFDTTKRLESVVLMSCGDGYTFRSGYI